MAFKETEIIARQIESFCAHQDEIYAALAPYSDCAELSEIRAICNSFRLKAEDFFRENRKYNLAVIGQVKAGKTSFLNTLLFGGEEVLPKDSVPKTAALTRIEYAPQNSIEVEYYSPEDWVWLKRLAVSKENSDRARAAIDTIIQAESSGIPVQELIFRGSEVRNFDSPNGLMEELNEYVGENGRYTPLVKAATLRINLEALRNISVVDTPGLNDPILSRTQRTREFIETCDAAFFLSRASYFMDHNDMQLLTTLLPQKGVRRLVLLASQFDSALMDVIYDSESLDAATEMAKKQLREHAVSSVEQEEKNLRRAGCSSHILEVVEQCKRPVFFSAMAENLSKKERACYTEQENVILEHLEYFGEIKTEKLREIGNMGEVNALFEQMTAEKDSLLEHKAAAMAAVGQSDLTVRLSNLHEAVTESLDGAYKIKRDRCMAELGDISTIMNELRSRIGAEYDEFSSLLDERVASAALNLERGERRDEAVLEKHALTVKTEQEIVSDTVIYKPWTWGKKHYEVTSEEVKYSYMDTLDTAESLRRAALEVELLHDAVFAPFADTARLGNRLRRIVGEIFVAGGMALDHNELERWIKMAKSRIVLPKLKLDPSPYILDIEAHFPKHLRSQNLQNAMQKYAAEIMGRLTNEAQRQLEHDAAQFEGNLENSEGRFYALASSQMAKRAVALRAEIDETGEQLARRRELLEIIENYI